MQSARIGCKSEGPGLNKGLGFRDTPLPFSINLAQKPYITGSLGPKALTYKSFEGKG